MELSKLRDGIFHLSFSGILVKFVYQKNIIISKILLCDNNKAGKMATLVLSKETTHHYRHAT